MLEYENWSCLIDESFLRFQTCRKLQTLKKTGCRSRRTSCVHAVQKMEGFVPLLTAESRVVRAKTLGRLLSSLKLNSEEDAVTPAEDKTKGKIKSGLDSDDEEVPDEEDEMASITPQLLICLRSDISDRCRELAFECLLKVVANSKVGDRKVAKLTVDLIHTMAERMDSDGEGESCEELRLAAIKAIPSLVDRLTSDLHPCILDALMVILSSGLRDPWAEVVKESARVLTPLIQELSEILYLSIDKLTVPLCKAITHHQSLVRAEVIRAIGRVLVAGGVKGNVPQEYIRHLTQRVFDCAERVRLALTQTAGLALRSFPDRYSHFHRLLPLILAPLSDESDEVKSTAWAEWEKVGETFLEENLEEYKNNVDFPKPPAPNYPPGQRRPPLGCRLLVQKEASKILPGALRDLTDWSCETRIACALLLHLVALHCEDDNGAFQAPALLAALLKAGADHEPKVLHPVLECAHLVGVFVPLTVSWPILHSSLASNSSLDGPLAVTACVFEGNKELMNINGSEDTEELNRILDEVTELLSSSQILHTILTPRHVWILRLTSALISSDSAKYSQRLFTSAFSVLAFSQDPEVSAQAMSVMSKIHTPSTTLSVLFASHVGPILEELALMPTNGWTAVTPEMALFEAIIRHGGSEGLQPHFEVITKILTTHVVDSVKDAEVRLSMLTLTATIVPDAPVSLLSTLLKDVVGPALIWRAGKTEAALRTAALSLLYTILRQQLPLSIGSQVVGELLEGCVGLVDDASSANGRLLSCHSLGFLASFLNYDQVLKNYSHLLRRLDDEDDGVRSAAVTALSRIFSSEASSKLPDTHIEHIADTLLLHLDDYNSKFQDQVLECIEVLGKHSSTLVVSLAEKWRPKHRSPTLCNSIIEFLQSL